MLIDGVPRQRADAVDKQKPTGKGGLTSATWDDTTREGAITFRAQDGAGESTRCSLAAGEGVLHMRIDGTADAVERIERVVGTHVVRFGARDGLAVQWQRVDGPGQSFTASETEPPSR